MGERRDEVNNSDNSLRINKPKTTIIASRKSNTIESTSSPADSVIGGSSSHRTQNKLMAMVLEVWQTVFLRNGALVNSQSIIEMLQLVPVRFTARGH